MGRNQSHHLSAIWMSVSLAVRLWFQRFALYFFRFFFLSLCFELEPNYKILSQHRILCFYSILDSRAQVSLVFLQLVTQNRAILNFPTPLACWDLTICKLLATICFSVIFFLKQIFLRWLSTFLMGHVISAVKSTDSSVLSSSDRSAHVKTKARDFETSTALLVLTVWPCKKRRKIQPAAELLVVASAKNSLKQAGVSEGDALPPPVSCALLEPLSGNEPASESIEQHQILGIFCCPGPELRSPQILLDGLLTDKMKTHALVAAASWCFFFCWFGFWFLVITSRGDEERCACFFVRTRGRASRGGVSRCFAAGLLQPLPSVHVAAFEPGAVCTLHLDEFRPSSSRCAPPSAHFWWSPGHGAPAQTTTHWRKVSSQSLLDFYDQWNSKQHNLNRGSYRKEFLVAALGWNVSYQPSQLQWRCCFSALCHLVRLTAHTGCEISQTEKIAGAHTCHGLDSCMCGHASSQPKALVECHSRRRQCERPQLLHRCCAAQEQRASFPHRGDPSLSFCCL